MSAAVLCADHQAECYSMQCRLQDSLVDLEDKCNDNHCHAVKLRKLRTIVMSILAVLMPADACKVM